MSKEDKDPSDPIREHLVELSHHADEYRFVITIAVPKDPSMMTAAGFAGSINKLEAIGAMSSVTMDIKAYFDTKQREAGPRLALVPANDPLIKT